MDPTKCCKCQVSHEEQKCEDIQDQHRSGYPDEFKKCGSVPRLYDHLQTSWKVGVLVSATVFLEKQEKLTNANASHIKDKNAESRKV